MKGQSVSRRPRAIRPWAMLVVATLLLLPTLVRANQTFNASASSGSIRLNRGFDAPQSKCKVPPPGTAVIALGIPLEPAPRFAQHPSTSADSTPLSQHDIPPDAFRGPPTSSLA